jgi:hypothetical protein
MYNTKRNRYQVVVAKYDEDIRWTKKYTNVKVYDKSKGDLPNIGRESHTYLTYIVENYHRLPEIVFFTQGNIKDHGYAEIDFINLGENKFSQNLTRYNYNYFFYCNKLGWNDDHIYAYSGKDVDYKDELGFRLWFKKYVDEEIKFDNYILLWEGAIFSVRRECILSRPKEYYKRLLDYIPKSNNPEVGHYLERSWYYIFKCNLNPIPSIRIVVSRYNENLNWLNRKCKTCEITVYNKGHTELNLFNSINLPNVGRESHTYLYHIIDNYDKLEDLTIFCQGSTNTHHLKKYCFEQIINNPNDTMFFGMPGDNMKDYQFQKIENIHISSSSENRNLSRHELKPCEITPYGKWREHVIGKRHSGFITRYGTFCVHKRHILQYPKSTYEELIKWLEDDENPESGHYMEKIWSHLFYPYPESCKVKMPELVADLKLY